MSWWTKKKNEGKAPKASLTTVPQHVAIIMDGNGRWAQKKGMPRTYGHSVGVDRVRDAVEVCLETGVSYLTLYAFSTENWRRPQEEVNVLMRLFQEVMSRETPKLHKNQVRIKIIGLKDDLSPALVRQLEESERITAQNTRLTLNLALNYGGRSEIATAVKKIAQGVQSGTIDINAIDEEMISANIFTAGQAEPDLLIRPGGEWRISNFLVWQMAYTDFYFSELYWPEFGPKEMIKAFEWFAKRERRFGGINKGGQPG